MAKRSTLERSGQAMVYNFLLNEVLASQLEPGPEAGADGSPGFWVVSPWVTDFRLASPYHVSFRGLVETRREGLHLFDVLGQLAANGVAVRLAVADQPAYLPALRALADRHERIAVRVVPDLHSKAYAGRFGALDGSLNLTAGGVNANIELLGYYHDERSVAELRRRCAEHFDRGRPL